MRVIYEPDVGRVASTIGERLLAELQAGKRVTWFISGGSNIAISVEAIHAIPVEHTEHLTVLLTDERYGMPGHADSNWRQLDDAGFQPGNARVLRTLHPEMTMEDTCTAYALDVKMALQDSDVVIAQFGIGGDGHIAGILPGADAGAIGIDDQSAPLVVGYDGGAFQRITITPPVWRHIGVAYAPAYGNTKLGTLQRLVSETLSITDQPSQLLKAVDESYLYTDQQLTAQPL